MYCWKCGKEIDDDAVVCVHCGCKIDNATQKKPGVIRFVLRSVKRAVIFLGTFLVYHIIFSNFFPVDETNTLIAPDWYMWLGIALAAGVAFVDKIRTFVSGSTKRTHHTKHKQAAEPISAEKPARVVTVEDMQQFPDIPIAWSYILNLMHTNGVYWAMLNWNNQKIVLNYLSQINDIIVDAQTYIEGLDEVCIDLNEIDFDYPTPMYQNSMCSTRIECCPYTSAGKISKYPVTIQWATKFDKTGTRCSGSIKILRDGNIGSAVASIRGFKFKIGLHGTTLVLLRVDNPYTGGNLFKFSETYD